MDDRQAFSSSIDDKKEQVPQQSDEVWSYLAIPRGKEFELPSVTSPLSSNGSENNDNLASPFQLLDTPTLVDKIFLEETIDPSLSANLADSLLVLETSPSLCQTIWMGDEQKGVPEGNKEVIVPVLDGLSSLEFDVDALKKSQEYDAGDSLNPPSSSSIPSQYPDSNLTSGHFFDDRFVFESGTLLPVEYQSQDILVAPYANWLGSNDFIVGDQAYVLNSSNEAASARTTANTTGFTLSSDMSDGLEYLNNCLSPTGISISSDNEQVTEVRSPLSSSLGLEVNGQSLGSGSFEVGHMSSYVSGDGDALDYIGDNGGREFSGYVSVGSPVSSYLKPQMMGLNSESEPADSVPATRLELGQPLVSMEKTIEENNNSNKRSRQEDHQQYDTSGNPISSVLNDSLSGESSLAIAFKNTLKKAREAPENCPSQRMLRPRKLVFEDFEKPEN